MNRKEKKLAGSLWQSKYPNSFSKLPDLGPANACTERNPTHEGEAQRAQHGAAAGATTPGPRGHRRGAALTPALREPRHRGCRARRHIGGWNISCCRCNAAWLENWLSCRMTTEKSFLKASFSKCARILLILAQEPAPAAQASSSSKPHVPGGTSICKSSPVIAE